MPLPDGTLSICVVVPNGRDQASVMHSICLERATVRPINDPRTGRPLYVYPHAVRVIGSEYAAARNSLVNLIFTAETQITLDYQTAENNLAASQSRAPRIIPPVTFDYSLWIDDDVMVPETVIEQLLVHDVHICSGLYFMRKPPYLPVVYTRTGDPDHSGRFWNLTSYPKNSLIEVDAAGMGCVLIDNDVFRKIPEPWFAWGTPDVVSPTINHPDSLTIKPNWDAMWNKFDHRAMGEDMYFFTKARQHGYQAHLSTGTVCQHIGEQMYDEAFFEQHQIHYYRVPPPGRMSVLFVVVPSPKQWDGRSLYDSPLGGSESAVAYLARSLARLHHIVFVICNTRSDNVIDVDGVCYRPYGSLNGALQHPWDAVIYVRWPDAVAYPATINIKAQIFWAHDLMSPPDLMKAYGVTLPRDEDLMDSFVSLTQFHQHFTGFISSGGQVIEPWQGVSRDIIPNGVDLSLFQGSEPRDPNRLVWTSNPNRGLTNAVRIFRRLREALPELTFHIYGRTAVYGWGSGDPLHERFYLPDPDEPNVVVHDPLPKAQLARELMKSWVMFYPATWPETFAISVLEAEAAGTPVIATPYGALGETVQGGILTWDFESAFKQLQDPKEWERQSLRGKEFASHLDWDTIALIWVKLVEAIQSKRRVEGKLV